MYIKVVLTSLFCILIGWPAFAAEKSFDFLGFTTNAPAPPASRISGRMCQIAQQGISSCNVFLGTRLGRASVHDLTITFNNARLVNASGFVVLQYHKDLADAFKAKYGLPSKVETLKWQNRAGNEFDNEVMTWTFEDGTLELHQRGSERDVPKFVFAANRNIPEDSPPPVNF